MVGRMRFERMTIALKVTCLRHELLIINNLHDSSSHNLLYPKKQTTKNACPT